MAFNSSLLRVLPVQPWRWTTLPDAQGNGGVKQTLNGVFILLNDEIVDYLRTTMTQAQKDEVALWVNRYTDAQCAEWNVPLWSGKTSAVYWRVPSTIWNNPATVPPAKVRNYFRNFYTT